jgi:hypothetical protein
MGKRENILRAEAAQAALAAEEAALRTGAVSEVSRLAAIDPYGRAVLPSQHELAVAGSQERVYTQGIRNLIRGELDPTTITERWRTGFAEPAMQAWWDYNAPQMRDDFAGVAGGFYSADRARRIGSEASRFMGTAVTPTLFASQEAAAARRPGMIGMLGQMGPASTEMDLLGLSQAATQSSMNPYLMAMLGIQPQRVDASKYQQESRPGALIGGIAGIALGGLTGVGALSATGLGMGQLGSMIGGLF